MSTTEQYDAVVIGSGESGKYIGWHLAAAGKRVAVIERRYLGGSCPNIACLPSKNVIHGAQIASYFRRSEEFGIVKGEWSVNMTGVRARKRQMVDGLLEMHRANFAKSGAELVMGAARFTGEKTVEITLLDGGTRVLHGDKIFLNLGTREKIEPIPGLSDATPMTHIEILELDALPEHLLVLGGGYVGLEFAQAFRRLGSHVTVIERNEQLLHREDPDVSEAVELLFRDEGIEVVTNAHVTRVSGISGDRVRLHSTKDGAEITLEGSHLLVATGRTPNTENIGLEIAGVALTDRGYVQVNERLETTAPDVWAMGDCAGSPLFTHIAFDDFRVVREGLAGRHRVTTGRQVPSCLFTDPELAHVGLSESEAHAQGITYRLAKIPAIAILRTRTLSETRGFVKALVSATDDRILGFTAFCTGAGEIMAPVQLAMSAGLPYTALRDLILTHPTLTEGLVSLFSNVPALQPAK